MKIKWFKIVYDLIIVPTMFVIMWNIGYELFIIWFIVFYLQIISANNNLDDYIKK